MYSQGLWLVRNLYEDQTPDNYCQTLVITATFGGNLLYKVTNHPTFTHLNLYTPASRLIKATFVWPKVVGVHCNMYCTRPLI